MSSRRLTSRADFNETLWSERGASAAFLTALAALALLAAGCVQNAKLGEAVSQRGYVRLAALVAAHPMQREAGRLRDMEMRLRQTGPLTPPAGMTPELPPLPNVASDGGLTAEGRQRREKERARLRAQIETQLAEFAAGRAARNARLLEQQKAELLGALTAQDKMNATRAKGAIEAQIIAELQALVKRKLEVYGRLAVLAGQLNDTVDYVAPPLSQEKPVSVEEGATTKKSTDKPVRLMSDFLEAQRQREWANLRALDAEIAAVKTRGRTQLSEAEADALAQRMAAIQAKLDALRDDFDFGSVEAAQKQALTQALLAEEKAWLASVQSAGKGVGTGTFRLTALIPQPVSQSLSTLEAAANLARQRAELERFLALNVADSVRDIARQRNLDIQIVQGLDSASAVRGKADQDRADMTSEFGRWISSAASVSTPAPTGKGGLL